IVKSSDIPEVSSSFSTMIVWMSETPMNLNGSYIIKRATSVINGSKQYREPLKGVFRGSLNSFIH
ncbi:MAG: hypothetical protein IE887_06555, partial [Campylobacterales bacterium]|nr:hypothetical protein [Campylobacterales bacterium]